MENLASVLGLRELLAGDMFAAQLGVLAVTTFLVVCSFVLCLMAFRAAGAARRARGEAEAHFRAAQDLAVEMRRLTAQVEKAMTRRAAAASVPSTPLRASAAEATGEAGVTIEPAEPEESADAAHASGEETVEAASAERALEAAKKAATIPSALLGAMLRRRS